MKKMYSTPNLEMISILTQDVLTTSAIPSIEQYNESVDQYVKDKISWN